MRKIKTFLTVLIIFTIALSLGCGKTHTIIDENARVLNGFEMTIFNTGKSDCILIRTDAVVVLNDTADEDDYEMISATLREKNIDSIDYMIISHFDKDHIGSAANIIDNFKVDNVIMPSYYEESDYYRKLINSIEKRSVKVISSDYAISYGILSIEVDIPSIDTYDDDNNMSAVTKVIYGDNVFLLPGDALKSRLEEYFGDAGNREIHYDVVKIAHHGDYNKYLKELIPLLAPFTAIITDDVNDKRTSDKLVKVLLENNCDILYSYDGDIVVTSDGTSISIVQ